MLICKLVGSLFLLSCGLALPRFAAQKRRLASEQAASWMALVCFIRRQVESYRLPIGEILTRYEGVLSGYGGDRPQTLAALSGSTAWFSPETERIASRFCREFGKGYYGEQMKLCDEVLAELSVCLKEMSANEEKKKKSEWVMSVFGSAVVVILLL